MSNDILRRAIEASENNTTGIDTGTPLQIMRARRKALVNAMNTMLETVSGERRDLQASEQRDFDRAKANIALDDVRIGELEDEEARRVAAAPTMRAQAHLPVGGNWSVNEPDIYRDPLLDPTSPSFFRDMARAASGDLGAMERLHRSQDGRELERRALGNTGAVGGSGGELAPPLWAVDQFVALARPGRVFADLATKAPMPEGVSSINIPKVLTGTSTAVQSTQNTALSQTDLTTSFLTSTITTIGGKQVVSQQLLDQAGVPIDRVVLGDLAGDYARALGSQYITGTGASGQLRGVRNAAGAASTVFTTATPKFVDGTTPANSFLNKVVAAKVAVATARYLPATACVMHPRRWGWIQEALDANGRPMITPQDASGDLNQPGTDGANIAQGQVGTLANLPVYLDPNVPTNLGAGTNQDEVYVCRVEDLFFWESQLQMETFRETYSDSLGVLFRCFSYAASVPDRFGASINIISGTGLIAPVL